MALAYGYLVKHVQLTGRYKFNITFILERGAGMMDLSAPQPMFKWNQ